MDVIYTKEVEKFVLQLEESILKKTLRTIDLLEKFGYELLLPYSRALGNGLFELRIRGQKNVRVLYCFHKNRAILLHSFIKKTQVIPKKDFNLAITRMKHLTHL